MQVTINELWTLILAVLAIRLGIMVHAMLPRLQQWNIPPAITGGLLIATGVTVARSGYEIEIVFADGIRQMLLLVFFAGVGLSAKFAALLRGGRGVAAVCVAIVLAIVAQNMVGVMVARSFGLEGALGLFFGSIPFIGGHGTAAAWAQAEPAQGLTGAFEVGMACATMGLIAGGLIAGPVSSWLARRQLAKGRTTAGGEDIVIEDKTPRLSAAELLDSDRWLVIVLILGFCLGLGEVFRRWAEARDLVVPGFLAVMAVAILITNAGDLLRRPVDLIVSDLTGTVALRLFLAISMMGLKLWELADFIVPMRATLCVQIVVVLTIGVAILYPLMGRSYESAVACGGFIGFAMGAMPVGLGVMKRVTTALGPAPKAFIAVTLAGALFQDTANAILVNLGFSLLQ